MLKTILITGATDGIGLATARKLVSYGHRVLLHGRDEKKLSASQQSLSSLARSAVIETYLADLSQHEQVDALTQAISDKHKKLDVVINNAGVFKPTPALTTDQLDMCFVINTLAPYLLTRNLLPLLDTNSRVVNVSSAAQSPFDLSALSGTFVVKDPMKAYAQSKLALIMWSSAMAQMGGTQTPSVITVNPGSMLGTKMVRDGFGIDGGDINIGAEIIFKAALSDTFSDSSGKYFDNDLGKFTDPHPYAQDIVKCSQLVQKMNELLLIWR
ncbi:SDR family NAD(P)-dependent oxidoreductase [Vibrio misgurnus]|uniref:SDR family NAD(P)-dependent oxidoreductase n=1 Tax=Vibrio misgurnus TaxID=2993714 RepID=UPI0023F735E5|nr:SDR family NAD(P)-dependent oxidoreductase [Vibrio sp. VCS]